MAMHAKRSTVHLDPDLHKALRLKAVETSGSVPDPVNEAFRGSVEKDFESMPTDPVQAPGSRPLTPGAAE